MAKVHSHTAKCYGSTLNCHLPSHKHQGISCYTKKGDLKCVLQAHSHSSNCYTSTGPHCGNN